MAQPDHYVQTDCGLPDHPKVHALAGALKCHEITALGAIQALWCRVMRYCPSGDVSSVSERTLRFWVLGLPRISWAAFVEAGIVDQDGARRTLHGWERYDDKEARRAANAERMRLARAQRACAARALHVQTHSERTCAKSAGAEGEEEGEKEEEVRVVEAARDLPPSFPKPSENRAELVARWNSLAERCGLPQVRPDDAPAWAGKADARIGEGVLERWDEIASGVAAIVAEPRYAGARPKWLKFAHLVANGTNWRRLAADGVQVAPAAAPVKTRGQVLLESVLNPDGSLPT